MLDQRTELYLQVSLTGESLVIPLALSNRLVEYAREHGCEAADVTWFVKSSVTFVFPTFDQAAEARQIMHAACLTDGVEVDAALLRLVETEDSLLETDLEQFVGVMAKDWATRLDFRQDESDPDVIWLDVYHPAAGGCVDVVGYCFTVDGDFECFLGAEHIEAEGGEHPEDPVPKRHLKVVELKN